MGNPQLFLLCYNASPPSVGSHLDVTKFFNVRKVFIEFYYMAHAMYGLKIILYFSCDLLGV